jgi:hypothetical protein
MKKLTIELDEEEIEIIKELDPRELDSVTIEGAIICGILQQIAEARTEKK